MGSIWIIVSSNSGVRLGTLLSLAGLFAWLTIMGSIWWLYGIGWAGDAPIWEEIEIVEGTDAEGHRPSLRSTRPTCFAPNPSRQRMRPSLRPPRRPRPSSAPTGGPWVRPVSVTMPSTASSRSRLPTRNSAASSPSASRPTRSRACPRRGRRTVAAEQRRNEATTWSELAAVAPGLIDQDNANLGGWTLLSTAEAGEAGLGHRHAARVRRLLLCDQSQFKLLDAYTIGGKEGLPDDPNVLDRVWTRIRQTAQITHPTRYGVIQVQQVTEESLTNLPGTAPQIPVVDEDEPIVSVVMVRNLGNLRQVPAFFTIGSLLIFLSLCYMLHERDKLVMARRAEFEKAA